MSKQTKTLLKNNKGQQSKWNTHSANKIKNSEKCGKIERRKKCAEMSHSSLYEMYGSG